MWVAFIRNSHFSKQNDFALPFPRKCTRPFLYNTEKNITSGYITERCIQTGALLQCSDAHISYNLKQHNKRFIFLGTRNDNLIVIYWLVKIFKTVNVRKPLTEEQTTPYESLKRITRNHSAAIWLNSCNSSFGPWKHCDVETNQIFCKPLIGANEREYMNKSFKAKNTSCGILSPKKNKV